VQAREETVGRQI